MSIVQCQCDSVYLNTSRTHTAAHLLSKKHQNFIRSKNFPPEIFEKYFNRSKNGINDFLLEDPIIDIDKRIKRKKVA